MSGFYDEILMDHIRNARNYRVMADPDERIEAANPLCGDRIELQVKWAGDRVADAAFQCEACGISMASTSVLTELVGGLTRPQLLRLCDEFATAIRAQADAADLDGRWSTAQLAILATARRFPARESCARLPWDALSNALRDRA
ncbi:MAG: Fe-S cluster assembly sulfur transfer protein SufU [Burkholderiales bacterium]